MCTSFSSTARRRIINALLADTVATIRTGMTGVGALAPAATGYLADVASFTTAFGLIAVATVVAGALILGLR